jgi:hypothetical protein
MRPMLQFVAFMHDFKILIVGEDQLPCLIPKDMLCEKSEFFAKALAEGRFKESLEGVIHLPEDDSRAFAAFYYWLHTGEVRFEGLWTGLKAGTLDLNEHVRECIAIWVFGDKYHVPVLQNAAVGRLCEVLGLLQSLSSCKRDADDDDDDDDDAEQPDNHNPNRSAATPPTLALRATMQKLSVETLTQCFASTRPNSPLRILAADYVVQQIEGGPGPDHEKVPPSTFNAITNSGQDFSEIDEAQAHFHAAKDDRAHECFLRFLKPLKYRKLLFVDLEEAHAHTHSIGGTPTAPYGDPYAGAKACTECGDVSPAVMTFCGTACVEAAVENSWLDEVE